MPIEGIQQTQESTNEQPQKPEAAKKPAFEMFTDEPIKTESAEDKAVKIKALENSIKAQIPTEKPKLDVLGEKQKFDMFAESPEHTVPTTTPESTVATSLTQQELQEKTIPKTKPKGFNFFFGRQKFDPLETQETPPKKRFWDRIFP